MLLAPHPRSSGYPQVYLPLFLLLFTGNASSQLPLHQLGILRIGRVGWLSSSNGQG